MNARGLTLREEESGDRDAVRAVNRAAFAGDVEADLVERLHADEDALFGLVAEVEGRVVAHILFSRLPIEPTHGPIPAAALAPLAVLPERQGQGIGTALVRAGLARCRNERISVIVVLGDPAYYGRFGFRAETARGLRTPWSGPHLLAVELSPSGLADGPGIARYPTAFAALPSEEASASPSQSGGLDVSAGLPTRMAPSQTPASPP